MSNLIKILQSIVFTTVILVGSAISACSRETPPAAPAAGSSRLADLLRAEPRAGYDRAIEPRTFAFPADHGPHPGYRNEWWYFTGNLDGPQDRRFGYELTIFRFSLTPSVAIASAGRSAWRSNDVFIGHFAITDIDNDRFHVAERYSRDALSLAGATVSPVRVWIEDWSMTHRRASGDGGRDRSSETWLLQASHDRMSISLSLTPLKDPVLHGVRGLLQKSAEVGSASYYYSVPRLQTEGTLSVGENVIPVSGLSWLDREWGSSGLAADQQGWDWFALQLADGSDLMLYRLRRLDGTVDRRSAGTWMPAHGGALHLPEPEIEVEILDYWDSPRGDRYPMAWTLTVARLKLTLEINPAMRGQELGTTVRYWEGAVDVEGERNGQPVSGRGYVELTGYADSGP